jgi:hypothetical protein
MIAINLLWTYMPNFIAQLRILPYGYVVADKKEVSPGL